jgi:hypothetical protein
VIVASAFVSHADGIGGCPEGQAALAALAGGVAVVGAALAAPVIGTPGLILSFEKVSPAELAEREGVATNALSQMAAQRHLHGALLQVGSERIRGGLASAMPEDQLGRTPSHAADAILDAQVDDVRLDRAGSGEGSYFLRIKTHARVVRVVDGAICWEQSAEYHSGKGLFVDWTQPGAIQAVAETGYRALACHYVDQLVASSSR